MYKINKEWKIEQKEKEREGGKPKKRMKEIETTRNKIKEWKKKKERTKKENEIKKDINIEKKERNRKKTEMK